MQVFLCLLGILQIFLQILTDKKKYEDSVSANSPFVIGDSVSSNDINRMKRQRLDNANNTVHFLQAYNLTSLIKETTCFQFSNSSCTDHVLTNQKNMFRLSNALETGLSDHHKLISTVAKFGSLKGRPREKIYRSYRSFSTETVSDKLPRIESNSYNQFKKAFLTVLNKQAPLKTKFLRHKNNPFMTKELRKTI